MNQLELSPKVQSSSKSDEPSFLRIGKMRLQWSSDIELRILANPSPRRAVFNFVNSSDISFSVCDALMRVACATRSSIDVSSAARMHRKSLWLFGYSSSRSAVFPKHSCDVTQHLEGLWSEFLVYMKAFSLNVFLVASSAWPKQDAHRRLDPALT